MMTQIVFRKRHWCMVEEHFSLRHDVETGAFALFKISSSLLAEKFLVNRIILPTEDNYLKRDSARVGFKSVFMEKVFQLCETYNSHLLDIHNHPWSTAVEFSGIDDNEAQYVKAPYMTRYLPGTRIAFIVFGVSPSVVRARQWEIDASRLSDLQRIVVV